MMDTNTENINAGREDLGENIGQDIRSDNDESHISDPTHPEGSHNHEHGDENIGDHDHDHDEHNDEQGDDHDDEHEHEHQTVEIGKEEGVLKI